MFRVPLADFARMLRDRLLRDRGAARPEGIAR